MTQRRYEFSKAIRKEALARSGKRCEAVGKRYGFEEYHRCNRDLSYGFEIDHYPLPAYQAGSNTIENAICCCKRCNQYAANHEDKPRAAKERRVKDKHAGVTKPKYNWPKRPFNSAPFSNTKQLQDDGP